MTSKLKIKKKPEGFPEVLPDHPGRGGHRALPAFKFYKRRCHESVYNDNSICGLFGISNNPFFYIPIDFASILWAKGIDPDICREQLASDLGIDVSRFKKHNALDDARLLRALYEKLSADQD